MSTEKSSFDAFIDDLIDDGDDFAQQPVKPSKTKKTFPCPQCGGTGLWNGGRINRHGNAKCNTCMGSGTVKTDPRKLQEQRIKRAEKKTAQQEAARNANVAAIGAEALEELGQAAGWSDFARSLMEQHFSGKQWSDKQVHCILSMVTKIADNRAKREQARQEEQVEVDLQPIRDMFETAVANGYQKPIYRAEGLIINRAPMHGRNPGALYVKNESDVYGGKVIETTFQPSQDGKASDFVERGTAADALKAIAKDPLAAAVRYGQRTGKCACCGRKLTNKLSIDLGIGPICREKWGL